MYLKKYFLKGPALFNPSVNKMKHEGDIVRARNNFLNKRFRNLDFLLKKRFSWMNEYIEMVNGAILEIGCGAAFSSLYIEREIIHSDYEKTDWMDMQVDALNMDIEDESIGAIIASHNIHHFSNPFKFFKEVERVLKPSGLLIIQEVNTSLCMRLLLKFMRHEGWSYEIDPFSKDLDANDPNNPWSANCSIPEMLFDDSAKFENIFSRLQIIKNKKNEFLIFPLSGGVIAKIDFPELPNIILNLAHLVDRVLVRLFPNIFAMGMSVVIKKIA